MADEKLLDVPSAAKFLGLSIWQLRGVISRSEVAVIKVGRSFYFRPEALRRWAQRAECRQ